MSLELTRAVAARLVADPSAVIGIAFANLDRWRSHAGTDPAEARLQVEWRHRLTTLTPFELSALLTEESERGRLIRKSAPFAGVLAPEERSRILDACETADRL